MHTKYEVKTPSGSGRTQHHFFSAVTFFVSTHGTTGNNRPSIILWMEICRLPKYDDSDEMFMNKSLNSIFPDSECDRLFLV